MSNQAECPAQSQSGVTGQRWGLNPARWAPVPLACPFFGEGTLLALDEEGASSPGHSVNTL